VGIKTLRADCPRLKIVAVWATGRGRYLNYCRLPDKVGAGACLAEPLTPKRLIQRL
jgi:hypothetical protein